MTVSPFDDPAEWLRQLVTLAVTDYLPVTIGITVVVLALMLISSIGLAEVFAKLGVPRGRAWIPFANLGEIVAQGGHSRWWGAVILIPGPNLVTLVLLGLGVAALSRRFGRGPGTIALGCALFPVWALALGLGGATAGAAPTRPRHDAPVSGWGAPPAVPQVMGSPLGVVATVLPSAPPPPPASGSTAGALLSLPPTLGGHANAATDSQFRPKAPPVEPRAVGAPPPLPPVPGGVPVLAVPVGAPPAPRPAPVLRGRAVAPDQAPDDATRRVATRKGRGWYLDLVDGSTRRLDARVILLGRSPVPDPDQPGALLISIADPDKTVSKTHARLWRDDADRWHVTDLGSTNGVVVTGADAAERELVSGRSAPLVADFRLGEYSLRLRRVD